MAKKPSLPDLSRKTTLQPSIEAQLEKQPFPQITPEGQKFIEGKVVKNPSNVKGSSNKTLVTLRMDNDLLKGLDEKAKSFGLNRTAYISMLVKRSIQQDLKLEI